MTKLAILSAATAYLCGILVFLHFSPAGRKNGAETKFSCCAASAASICSRSCRSGRSGCGWRWRADYGFWPGVCALPDASGRALAAIFTAGCAETPQTISAAPSTSIEASFSVEGALLEDAEALLAETQNLPVLHTSPLAMDAETLYRDLTGGCDMLDLERSVYETPSPSTVVCFFRGEAPLYDFSFLLKPWTAQQTHAPRSIIPLLPITISTQSSIRRKTKTSALFAAYRFGLTAYPNA